MTLERLDILMLEIDRQIAIASNSSQQTPFMSNHSLEGPVIEDRRYYLDFKDWCQTLSMPITPHEAHRRLRAAKLA